MTYSLDGCRLKLARAEGLIVELATRCKAHDFGEFVLGTDATGNWQVFRWKAHDPPDPSWPLLVGDALHNMRTALDYLAWECVRAAGNEPDRHTSFPIALTEADWDQYLAGKFPPTAGMSDAVLELVHSAQPFVRQEFFETLADMDLSVLKAMDDTDKHRTLHVVVVWTTGQQRFRVVKGTLEPGQLNVGWGEPAEMELADGAEIFRFQVLAVEGRPDPVLDMEPTIPVTVAFGAQGIRPVRLRRLRQILTTVVDIVDEAECRLTTGGPRWA